MMVVQEKHFLGAPRTILLMWKRSTERVFVSLFALNNNKQLENNQKEAHDDIKETHDEQK